MVGMKEAVYVKGKVCIKWDLIALLTVKTAS